MGSCFGAWARLITKCNRLILVVFVAIYIALAQNIKNAKPFPSHASESYVWAPANNPTIINEAKHRRMWTHAVNHGKFWYEVALEKDPAKVAEMIDTWEYDPAKYEGKR